MKKTILPLFMLCLFFASNGFAERYIQPAKYDDQEEFFIKGAPFIVSDKINSVLMYQTCKTIKNRKGNFYFILSNKTDKPINFSASKLRVTDQWGRHIRIISKKEQIANKKRSRNWSLVASAICAGLDTMNAQNAGNVTYQSQTYETQRTHVNTRGSEGWINTQSVSTTTGTAHIEGLRQQAQRQAFEDSAQRTHAISGEYESWEYRLDNFYFDTTTVFPGDEYAANFQIEMNKKVEKDLQYLLFTYYLDGEEHTFCFYCGKEKKKWWQSKS